MLRWTTLLLVVASLTTAGCRYCASPYDYCGPLFTGQDCTTCDPHTRAGSIFADQLMPVPMSGQECCQTDGTGLQPVPEQIVETTVEPAPVTVRQPAHVIQTSGPMHQGPPVHWPHAPWHNGRAAYSGPWMPRR
jgi:hypothetical protein